MYKFDKTSDPKLALAFATALAVKKVEGNEITQLQDIETLAATIKVKAL